MKKYTTFYIVRHAKSKANHKDIIAGQTIDSQLSIEGIKEARNRAKDLKSVHFDAAFSSDLFRANRTAKIIAEEHKLAVTTVSVLRERNYGDAEGKRYDELEEKLRKQFDIYNEMEYKERFTSKIVPNMETDEEVVGRLITFLRETALAFPGKNVLVVSHGNVIRTLLIHLGFATVKELPYSSTKNTCYFVLETNGVEFKIIKTVGIEKS